ncbi:glycoside hydrolase family 25 protein [Streptomyces stramineus]|uniref:Glycoside hydrolase family 25 protein n=1 Tax=Streptomyces stramineus TaxID=173861 RepID=A0ABP3K0G5_9ACTN
MIHGIDVSSHQRKNYPIGGSDFVFVKVSEGTSYTNPKWMAQRDRAERKGLVVGFYHYVTPGSMAAQVDYFLGEAQPRAGHMLALDWEDPGVSCKDKDRWIAEARSAAPGHRVVLYCNRDYWLHRDTTSRAGDGLWIADPDHPAGHPAIEHPWTFHQYSSADGLDRNVGRFVDRAALSAWASEAKTRRGPR